MYACHDIGAYFSSYSFGFDMYLQGYNPQVKNDPVNNPLTDTLNWMEVKGTFKASGAECFITIGNFLSDTVSHYTYMHPPIEFTSDWHHSYYYLDDVSVRQVPVADAGPDSVICTSSKDSIQLGTPADTGVQYHWHPALGLSDTTIAQPYAKPNVTTNYYLTITDTVHCTCTRKMSDTVKITVYCKPTPPVLPVVEPVFGFNTIIYSGQTFFIRALEPNTQVSVYNALGQLIFTSTNYQNDLLADELSSGIYFYRMIPPDGLERNGKICVIH
jgi:hypothetical protein